MKTIATLALALSLAGCATGTSIFSGGQSLTASIANPVTPTMLYNVENGLTVAVTGMLTYKRLCASGTIPASCRAVVTTLQGYTRQAKPVLVSLRGFVRNNDQINALIAYNTVSNLLTSFQNTAAQSGVK